ncbi:DUF3572 domain-containing protein [Sulfitobacter guttiformis]|uniref:Uncharacterized protein DUF3572 n=1 Tax=Sulfitobacter guttiformis TaxID=74349 RepID=A0A420DNV6_9RHOB|nr:DUF3572 domain-containing protein [Sulfitobacter guttiformis]KIN73215.1 DUF3572 domain containing protein [Sulfitobacter guttiformis KCTC 32187]RKE95890.1 uncharacterized protein DUF3572 [Sulfitobacter guttiformis]
MALTRNAAETIAIETLTWLVGNEDLLPVFLGSTGASAADMRSAVDNPDFLGSVLDFIMMDDAWVIACCDAQRIPYERLAEARMGLPGGEQRHWT